MFKQRIALTLLLLVTMPLTAAGTGTTIVLVRHAEKSAPNGDVALSAEGHRRAAILAAMLRDAGVDRVFTTQMMRSRETAEPLVKSSGRAAEVIPVEDVRSLVEKLEGLEQGSLAVVVSHGSTIPRIVEQLGGGKIAPIAEDEYDRLLIVVRSASGVNVTTLRYGNALDSADR